MTNRPFNSKSFKEYVQSIQAKFIEMDFHNRQIVIKNKNEEVVSTIFFSKSIQHRFTVSELLNTEHKVGDNMYAVYLEGYENKHWLWCGEVIDEL